MTLVKSNPDLEARLEAMSDSQMKDSMAAMELFNEELKKAGVLKDCDGLRLSREGKRVRFDGTARAVIDGPFNGDLVLHRRGGRVGQALPEPHARPVGDRDQAHLTIGCSHPTPNLSCSSGRQLPFNARR